MDQTIKTIKKRNEISRFISLMNEDSLEKLENILITENFEVDVDDKAEIKENLLEAISLNNNALLTEEFKEKVAVLFNAAVNDKVNEKVRVIQEEIDAALEDTKASAEAYANYVREELESENETKLTELEEKLDSYLDYVINEWTEENKLGIESGVKAQISESVLLGLKKLFEDNSIEISDDQINLVSELENKTKKLYESNITLNDQIRALAKKNSDLNKQVVLESVSNGLTTLEKDRLNTLAKSVKAKTVSEFKSQVQLLKESISHQENIITNRNNVTDTQLNEGKINNNIEISDEKIKSYVEAFDNMFANKV